MSSITRAEAADGFAVQLTYSDRFFAEGSWRVSISDPQGRKAPVGPSLGTEETARKLANTTWTNLRSGLTSSPNWLAAWDRYAQANGQYSEDVLGVGDTRAASRTVNQVTVSI
jgi:hypothetical protein